MAPVPITEDYYLILEVTPDADADTIKQSYRRLARKLHPDKNPSSDATQGFQLVCLSIS